MDVYQEMFEIFSANSEHFTLIWNKNTGCRVVSDGCSSFFREGIKRDGLGGLQEIVSEKDFQLCKSFTDDIMLEKNDKNNAECFLHLRNDEGKYNFYKVSCCFHKNDALETDKFLLIISEVTPEENYRIELAKSVTNDRNPAFFAIEADKIMRKYPELKFALVQFDVSKFKVINEQYGEHTGDEILSYFIDMLKLICNEKQLFTRLSADVFMVLTPYETNQDICEFIDVLNSRLSGYKDIPYTLYFGASYVTSRKEPIRKFGDEAAMARQSIKGDALKHVAFYTDEMKTRKKCQKYLEDHMEDALANREFVMFLQPKYSISLNKIVGAEALIRWINREKGMISPGEFIPLFEENGFIIKMDRFIWEEACRLIKYWNDSGIEPIPISVNMSRKHFESDSSLEFLNELIEKYGIEKKYLEIEITETIDDINKEHGIDMLKKNGYTLLMDDFGSGYSSLSTLKNTQFDVVKIDRFFLQDLIDSRRGQKIVEHTIHMAKDIGLELIAEGVETSEQANFLENCGCDVAQGFFYARPMDVAAFHELRKAKI